MFSASIKATTAQVKALGTENWTDSRITIPVEDLPGRYSLEQLHLGLVSSRDDSVGSVLLLEHCLQSRDGLYSDRNDSESAQRLLSWLSDLIIPTGDLLLRDERLEANTKIGEKRSSDHLHFISRSALASMKILHEHFEPPGRVIDPLVLLAIISYTEIEDPWTSEESQGFAKELLDLHGKQLSSHEFIVDNVLIGYIRPLFSSSRPAVITVQGRRALHPVAITPSNPEMDKASKKPWKFRNVSATTVLRWVIKFLDEAMLYQNWHLCAPPLLTLLDDPSTVFRARGLDILIDLLGKTPSGILHQTGLGEVIEDAVMPSLLFLPSLTPVEESLILLKSAYAALFLLGDVKYRVRDEQHAKMRFLDRLMRQGILQGFMHCPDNVLITEVLLGILTTLLYKMGICAVKYLKDIIPILSATLMDPFGSLHPRRILVAVRATQATIANCWPRMTESTYRLELIKCFALCWRGIVDDVRTEDDGLSDPVLQCVRKELQVAIIILADAVEGKVDMRKELEVLVLTDPQLRPLFQSKLTSNHVTE